MSPNFDYERLRSWANRIDPEHPDYGRHKYDARCPWCRDTVHETATAVLDVVDVLTDALDEFYDFVSVHLDPHPAPLIDYLNWPAERKAALCKAIGVFEQIDREPAQIDGSGTAS